MDTDSIDDLLEVLRCCCRRKEWLLLTPGLTDHDLFVLTLGYMHIHKKQRRYTTYYFAFVTICQSKKTKSISSGKHNTMMEQIPQSSILMKGRKSTTKLRCCGLLQQGSSGARLTKARREFERGSLYVILLGSTFSISITQL